MLYIYPAGSLQNLWDAFYEISESTERGGVLEPLTVIVPNRDTGRWLQLRLAKKRGISANLKTTLPAAFVHELNLKRDSGYEAKLPDKSSLTWRIYRELGELSDNPVFSELTEYAGTDELRRYQLSAKIADLFDKYMLFRTDWLDSWNHGKSAVVPNPHEHWQRELWSGLKRRDPDMTDRAELHDRLLDFIFSGEASLPATLYVFAPGDMPPVYVEVFEAISRQTDVHWLRIQPHIKGSEILPKPHPHYDHHPLLKSLGAGQAAAEYVVQVVTKKGNPVIKSRHVSGPEPQSLLGSLQHEIRGFGVAETFNPDASVQIHACHNAMREVEIIQDQILEFLQTHPDCGPGDVLVVMPDISRYAEMIRAVFSRPVDDNLRLPIHISDPASSMTLRLFHLLERVLRIHKSRFKVSAVMNILDSSPVREKFGLEPDDISLIEHWLAETSVRWGLDADYRGDEGIYSWQFGLDRLLLGIMMPVDFDEESVGIYPFADLEGADAWHLAGLLYRFVKELKIWSEFADELHPPTQWAQKITSLMEELFPGDAAYELSLKPVHEALKKLGSSEKLIGENVRISLDIVLDALASEMDSASAGSAYRSGSIVFSSMVPVRQLPFECIGVLGLNETDFPGRDIKSSFDLMASAPRPGDRSIRVTNRGLFLDTLLAAGKRLHLSYTGFNMKDGSEIPSSQVVTELLDYLDSKTDGKARQSMVYRHRMHAFHPAYFGKESPLFTCQPHRAELAGLMQEIRNPENAVKRVDLPLPEYEEEPLTIHLDEIRRFLTLPYTWLMENRLNMKYRTVELAVNDRDPFEFDNLEKWILGREVFAFVTVEGSNEEKLYQKLRKKGALEYGEAGRRSFERKLEEIKAYWYSIPEPLRMGWSGKSRRFETMLMVDGRKVRISGQLPEANDGQMVVIETSKINPKRKLGTWLQHLAANLDESITTELITMDSKKSGMNHLHFEKPEHPQEIVGLIIKQMLQTTTVPSPAYPKAVEKVKEFVDSGRSDNKFKAVLKYFQINEHHSYNTIFGEDEYAPLFVDGPENVNFDLLESYMEMVWNPMEKHISQEDD